MKSKLEPILTANVKVIKKEENINDKSQCDNIQRGSNDIESN